MGLLDSATDRLLAQQKREFEEMVEAVRIGTVIAHDANAARKWMSRPTAMQQQRGATGEALEQAVANIALIFPEHVVHGTV